MYDINKVGSINLVVQLILPLIAGKVEISACIVGYCSSVLYYVFEANSYWNWGMKNGPISVKFSYNYFYHGVLCSHIFERERGGKSFK